MLWVGIGPLTAGRTTGRHGGQITARVDISQTTTAIHSEVDMRPRGVSGHSNAPDFLSRSDSVASLYQWRTTMLVTGRFSRGAPCAGKSVAGMPVYARIAIIL